LAFLGVMLSATPAVAAPGDPVTLGQVVDNARLWIMGLLAAVATLFFVIGAARYVMAGGDPGQVERAKLTLKSALAGYGLALLAPVVLSVLRGIVGG
jgi:putative exporter of polyketide antibiotics